MNGCREAPERSRAVAGCRGERARGGQSFVVSDPDPCFRTMLTGLVDLVSPGARVCATSTVGSALDIARRESADVIVAAICEPDRSGRDVAVEVSSDLELSASKLILTIGQTVPGERDALRRMGVFRVLGRPIRRVEMAEALLAASRAASG